MRPRVHERPPLHLERVATLGGAREGWDELAAATGNPFATYEWTDAWWTRYGEGRALAVRRVHTPDGRLAAILPLYRSRRGPATVLRFLGHGASDELGPLCAPADRALAAAALLRAAEEEQGIAVVLAERLPGDAGYGAALGGRVVRRDASPLVDTEGRSWDEWLESRSANFRQQARRLERRLARDHALAFRLADDPARLDADLDTLFALHDARWSGGSDAFTEERRALHRDFAARALDRGWLRLWFAEVDGAAAAGWYGLRYAGSDWYYQLGRDPRWDRYRVGFVLLVHTVRAAFEDGMRSYRFGLGPEDYKDRFASRDPGTETVVAGGPAAALVAGGARLARRLPAGPRRLVKGRG